MKRITNWWELANGWRRCSRLHFKLHFRLYIFWYRLLLSLSLLPRYLLPYYIESGCWRASGVEKSNLQLSFFAFAAASKSPDKKSIWQFARVVAQSSRTARTVVCVSLSLFFSTTKLLHLFIIYLRFPRRDRRRSSRRRPHGKSEEKKEKNSGSRENLKFSTPGKISLLLLLPLYHRERRRPRRRDRHDLLPHQHEFEKPNNLIYTMGMFLMCTPCIQWHSGFLKLR